jgi:7-dehydrocholesterol reductase
MKDLCVLQSLIINDGRADGNRESLFNPGLVYDYIGEIFSVLVIASYVATILLYCKGHMAPSSEDWGSSGNILGDIFWGMELYPRITSHFDIKVFLNCRFAIMSWAIIVVSFAIKQRDNQGKIADSMLVTTVLMLIYITKFFWTESQFYRSMEMAHDRASTWNAWSWNGLQLH